MLRLLLLISLFLSFTLTTFAQDGHEYSPLEEKTINYKDWTYKNLYDGKDAVNLRDWSKGKRLVLVVYYAPWCGNWKFEAPVVARLYEKYKDHGFDVIAVNEYGSPAQALEYIKTVNTNFTYVVESEETSAREKTTHYAYRKACGDNRNFGSPFNIFLDPEKLNKEGELLTEKAWVVNGELVETEVEKFIREKLGIEVEGKGL
ncbi:MAG: TlpA family protein disulfide reductase [Blastocatellia bacterium]|nr:TlpA family protein disulfide reductase [Blastocatellia bacterium]